MVCSIMRLHRLWRHAADISTEAARIITMPPKIVYILVRDKNVLMICSTRN